MSATARVFGIAELHEYILKHLPMLDLLLAQRVNSTSRDAITTSTQLQQQLYLKPMMTSSSPLVWASQHGIVGADWYEHSDVLPESTWAMPEVKINSKSVNVFSNPVIELLEDQINRTLNNEPFSNVQLPSAWTKPNASWRRMLICQPRITGQIIYSPTGYDCPGSPLYFDPDFEDSNALLLDDIFEDHVRGRLHAFNLDHGCGDGVDAMRSVKITIFGVDNHDP